MAPPGNGGEGAADGGGKSVGAAAGPGPLALEGCCFESGVASSKDKKEDCHESGESQLGSTVKFSQSSFITPGVITSESVETKAPWQRTLKTFMNKPWFESGLASAIFFNFILICLETDSRADFPGQSSGGDPPKWVSIGMVACYILFTLELFLRLAIDGMAYVRNPWGKLDCVIIGVGAIEYMLSWVETSVPGLGIMRVIRLCRLLRLMRVLRLFSFLKELRRLLEMMGGCFKTLFWSFLLLCLVMTIWATVAVEVLNPLVQDVAEKGVWDNCDRCKRSFASVFMANMTFFQTVVAGDSWGYLAIPVIEEYPHSMVVFVGSLLTLIFGVLNLIVAVVVDTFAESREKDVVARAADMDAEEVAEKRVLAKIFEKIDEDASGSLSYDELAEGAQKVAEFRHWLRVMDIDAHDLRQLFIIVDEDGSGEIDPDEFIEAMYRMKNAESRTTSKFVKHIVTRMERDQQTLKSDLSSIEETLEKVAGNGDEFFERAVGQVHRRLHDQELQLQRAIEVALSKASEVALEAGLQAATGATRSVLDKLRTSSKELVGGVHSRLRHRPLGVSSQRQPLPPPPPRPPGSSAAGAAVSSKPSGVSLPVAAHGEELQGSNGEALWATLASRIGTGPLVLVHASGGASDDDGDIGLPDDEM